MKLYFHVTDGIAFSVFPVVALSFLYFFYFSCFYGSLSRFLLILDKGYQHCLYRFER
jgi:hypothetical protein